MSSLIRRRPAWVRYLFILLMAAGLLMPGSVSIAAPTTEVVVEDPQLHPAYTTCSGSYWYPIPNDRGHTAYLTLNTDSAHTFNSGEWHPVIPQDGYYRVEAYIAGHAPIVWCTGNIGLINHDTTDARYTIFYANGVITRSVSQYPLSNQWLNLGEYYFKAGTTGYVSLVDLNGEVNYTTTVSFSAMRFTFTRFTRPSTYLPLVYHALPDGQPAPDVGVIQAQGFDVCGLPSISTMQTWWNASPYSFYGLYLGGIQLPSQCARADANWVHTVHNQGWSFIPTWVGPQAPCSPYSQKMSPDLAISYQQGRQEAESASARAAAIGLTNYGLGGTIIYYDLEVYGGASLACRQAAASFMNGWVERLGELGNLAGGYGAHNSYVVDWASNPQVPTDVWAADWYATGYDSYASVYNIPWLQGLWTNHQRIRQYAGEHHESWGGIGIAIDSDVADGLVAMPPAGLRVNPLVISSPSIEDTGWLTTDRGWLVSQGQLYWTADQGNSWVDISPSVTQLASFLSDGQAWALSGFTDGAPAIYHSSDLGASWTSQELSLPPGDWTPVQLQFTSATSGWIVLRRVTSSAFDVGILIKTADGGHTWQTYELPVTGKISFTSLVEGWLINLDHTQLYHTMDGGNTWQVASLADQVQSETPPPLGTAISGWHAGGLGWAATSTGTCLGDKSTPGFACQVEHTLWQSRDGGTTWQVIPLPAVTGIKP